MYLFPFYTKPIREARSYGLRDSCLNDVDGHCILWVRCTSSSSSGERERERGVVCPLYFINGRVWHRDRFASVSRAVRSSEMQDGCIGSDVTRGWPLFDREPHYIHFHEPASMLRQLQLSPIALDRFYPPFT